MANNLNALGQSALTVNTVQVGEGTSAGMNSIPVGTAGQVLTSNGSGVDPSFQNAGGATAHNFLAYLANNLTNAVGHTNNYLVKFDTVLFDTDTAYSTGSGVYTIPTAGVWEFGTTITIGGSPWTGISYINIFFEGTFSLVPPSGFIQSVLQNVAAETAVGDLFPTITASTMNQFAAGDTITVRVGIGNASSGTNDLGIQGNASEFFTQFWGYKVG